MARRLFVLAVIGLMFFPTRLFAFQPLFDTWIGYDVWFEPYSVQAADLDNDGDLDLVVANVAYGFGSPTDSISVLLNNGDGTFAPRINFEAGDGPIFAYPSKLNGDSCIDIAVATDGGVSVFINKKCSTGTFGFFQSVHYTTGPVQYYVYASDFDGDNDQDLAVANRGSSTITVLKNKGDGTFSTCSNPKGDLNGDGKVIAGDDSLLSICIFIGTGNCDMCYADVDCSGLLTSADLVIENNVIYNHYTFPDTCTPKVNYLTRAFPYITAPISVFDFDADNDGDEDLATGNNRDNSVSVLKNKGTGVFPDTLTRVYAAGNQPATVFPAKLDTNGYEDLVLGYENTNYVSVFMNDPDSIGKFLSKVDYVTGQTPVTVVAADLDGDTDKDLVTANHGSGSVSILKNNGNGTFAAKMDYPSGAGSISVTAFNLDGDGDFDLAVANTIGNNVAVLSNKGNGTFPTGITLGTGTNASSVIAVDLDGDGDKDLAVTNEGSNTVSVIKNNGGLSFASKVDYGTGTNPRAVSTADLDADGDQDLAVANYGSNNVSVLKNNGNGTFATKVDYAVRINPASIFAVDIGEDALTDPPSPVDIDLIVANYGSDTVSVLKNNGNGTFATQVKRPVGSHPRSVYGADLDGDEDQDLAVTNFGGRKVSILKNNGNGTFAAKVDYTTGFGPTSVFAVNVDTDGDIDLVVANDSSSTVSVLKNNGNATFAAKDDYGTNQFPTSVFVADVDGDTDRDLAAATAGGRTVVSVLKNNGSGVFNVGSDARMDYGTGGNAQAVYLADLDGDGDLDMVTANELANTVTVIKNLSIP